MEDVDCYVMTGLTGADVMTAFFAVLLGLDAINEALKTV